MLNSDLAARLRWLAEHDDAELVEVLATAPADALRRALARSATPTRSR